MDINTTLQDGYTIATVTSDRIDSAVAIQFKDMMRAITDEGPEHLVLNLSDVKFIDSSGLGAIVAAMKQMNSAHRFDLAGLTKDVDKVFRLTRMDSVFVIHDDISLLKKARAAG